MSLAMFAAPFNENSSNDDNLINKKKQTHNKTQKTYSKDIFNSEKVKSVLEEIHNNSNVEDEEKDTLGEFNPPPMPESAGVTKTNSTIETMMNRSNEQNNIMFRTLGKAPKPNNEEENTLDLNNYTSNYGDNKSAEEYYNNIIGKYSKNRNPSNQSYYNYNNNNNSNNTANGSQDILLQKINYMINLLEEQQDERTNNVTEEVVLYSFLGVFIIFIVDSFAKVGKYVR
jgi:hypothetical protein